MIFPLGRLIWASAGYCASNRFQSHLLSASKCSSRTAWALGCFFRSGSFISACAAKAPPTRTSMTENGTMLLIVSSLLSIVALRVFVHRSGDRFLPGFPGAVLRAHVDDTDFQAWP